MEVTLFPVLNSLDYWLDTNILMKVEHWLVLNWNKGPSESRWHQVNSDDKASHIRLRVHMFLTSQIVIFCHCFQMAHDEPHLSFIMPAFILPAFSPVLECLVSHVSFLRSAAALWNPRLGAMMSVRANSRCIVVGLSTRWSIAVKSGLIH